MSKDKMDRIKEIIDNEFKDEAVIFTTDAGAYVKGRENELCFLLCKSVKYMYDGGVNKSNLDLSYELAYKNTDELLDIFNDKMEELIKTFKETFDKRC